MTDEEVLDRYEDVPLYFSHYYNFIFVYKSKKLDDGEQIFLQLGGTMELVSAMVVDVEDALTLDEKADDEYAYIKNAENQIVWKHGQEE